MWVPVRKTLILKPFQIDSQDIIPAGRQPGGVGGPGSSKQLSDVCWVSWKCPAHRVPAQMCQKRLLLFESSYSS